MATRKTKRIEGVLKFEDVGLEAYRASLLQVAVDVEREVLALASEFRIVNGRFVGTTADMQRLANTHVAIQEALRDAGYLTESRRILRMSGRVRTALERTYADAARSAVELTRPAVESLKVINSSAFKNFANIGVDGAEAMRQQLVTAVTSGQRVSEYQKTLSEYLLGPKGKGLLDRAGHGMFRHANTLANTAVAQLHRTMDNDLAEEAGVTRFRYMGPLDDVTRPFCERQRKRADEGVVLTKAQIDQLDNSPSGPGVGSAFTTGGGWNCRHVWEPIFDWELDDDGELLPEAEREAQEE